MSKAIFCILSAAVALAEAPSVVAIRNARIVTAAGPAIEKGTVVLRDGLIEAAGAGVGTPDGAWVIEGAGLSVYPGLIDALSGWGMPQAEPERSGAARPAAPGPPGRGQAQTPVMPAPVRGPEARPYNTSWLKVQDLVQPDGRMIAAARSAGFTTAVTFPMAGIFAGQGAVINLAGEKAGQMVVAAPAGLYLSLATRSFTSFPSSLMGAIAYIRQIYLDASHYREARKAYETSARGVRRVEYDRALEGVIESPRVLLPATRRVEIDRMIRFAAELKQPVVLYGGHEAYRVPELLKKADVPLLVSLRWPERAADADPEEKETLRTLDLRDRAPGTPAALAKAGVRFAFYSGGIERPADVRRAVKKAIDAGLAHDEAVRAMTAGAAAIYGVADRLGTIEAGKIANLVVTDGDLFQERTRVKYVFVDGVKFEPEAVSAPEEGGR